MVVFWDMRLKRLTFLFGWEHNPPEWLLEVILSTHLQYVCQSSFLLDALWINISGAEVYCCWRSGLLMCAKLKKRRVWRQGDEICVDELAGRDICSKRRNVLSYAASLGNRNSWTVSVVFVLLSAKLGTLNWYWSACISKMLCTHQFNSVLILWTHKVNLIDTLEF